MNVLVVGFGSIGRRHVDNLAGLDEIGTIFVLTSQKPELLHSGRVSFINALEFPNGMSSRYFAERGIKAAVIANDTSKHLRASLELAEAGLHLFIEKPLSHSMTGLSALKEIAERKSLKILVGYNMRFLGALSVLRDIIQQGTIGVLHFARIEVGYFLPLWRPSRDYRAQYSASARRGGGVALDLSHELDYMRYLFGQPRSWKVVRTKVSALEIDTDDLFEGLYQFENGFVCSVHLDYLQPRRRRDVRVVGSRGIAVCDLVEEFLKVESKGCDETRTEDETLFDMPKTYVKEMQHFIDLVQGTESPFVTLDDGIEVLRLLEDNHVQE